MAHSGVQSRRTSGGCAGQRRCSPLSEIKVLQLQPLDPEPVAEDRQPWYRPGEIVKAVRRNRYFLAFVVLPSLLATIYFMLIAAPRYEAEARFVVRTPSSSTSAQLANLVQGGSGVVRSSDDAYIVQAYLTSRDAVRKLASDHDLVARLQRPEADFLYRFPGPFRTASEESLWRHFQGLLSLSFDNSTGITTMRVQGFRPDDAQVISDALLTSAERLINMISERGQREALRAASEEVALARDKAQKALDAVSAFRRRNEMIDPTRTSNATLETITRLTVEIARTRAELEELRSVAAESPQAKTLVRRIAAYEEQITKERKAMAGSDTSIAPLIAEYEQLMLEREFAERTFASAQSAFNLARIDGERQRLFIERISSPTRPDYPKYPYRILNSLIACALAWMLFSIVRRVVADSRTHAEI